MATATKDRPILFNGEMVRAILDGRKTQTRRVVKGASGQFWDHAGWRPVVFDGAITAWKSSRCRSPNGPAVHCPYGKPGDRLWVRSQWGTGYDEQRNQGWYHGPEGCGMSFTVHGKPHTKRLGTQPSIHMPRWVAQELRLPVLQITEVRVERVQEIDNEAALAEGVETTPLGWKHYELDSQAYTMTPRSSFCTLWDSINGDRDGCSWAANPYCWCLTFKVVK